MLTRIRDTARKTILLLLAILFAIFPLLSMLSAALAPQGTIPVGISIPTDPQWHNFVDAWNVANITTLAKSSIILVLGVVPVSLLFAAMAGYALGGLKIPVFDFSLLKSPWDRDQFRRVITRSIADHRGAGGGLTWVLSSHDVPRHASRLALPLEVEPETWLAGNGTTPAIDPDTAIRRARAASLMMLALPGSAYLYQGEELGLSEVADLPADVLQDPVWERTGHTLKGRDGCRVPLPWTRRGTSFGFGNNGSWLPQPATFGALSVEAQDGIADSTLEMYRQAIALRRKLQTDDNTVEWLDADMGHVLHFRRSNGWECLVNFGQRPQPVPSLTSIISSSPLVDGGIPPEATVWFIKAPPG